MKTLLIIDTFNFLHRAYHALPKTFTDQNGEPTNAVYGVTSMLINVLTTIKPTHVVAAIDSKEPVHRHTEFTGYKAHRRPMEDDLSVQIPKVFEILDAFGIKQIQVSGYEADDIIAALVKQFSKDVQIIIVSNDRDLWQLVDDHTKIMLPDKGGTTWIDEKAANEKFGFNHHQIADYKGLRGDPSDNLPGVYGIGDKTAVKLILEYGNLESIYKNLSKIEPKSLRKKLENSYEQALMSKKLAELNIKVPFSVKLNECVYSDFNRGAVKPILEKYNFKSLIKRLGFEIEEKKSKNVVDENQLGLF